MPFQPWSKDLESSDFFMNSMLSVSGFRNSYFCQSLGPETIMTISVSIFLAVQKHLSCVGGGRAGAGWDNISNFVGT